MSTTVKNVALILALAGLIRGDIALAFVRHTVSVHHHTAALSQGQTPHYFLCRMSKRRHELGDKDISNDRPDPNEFQDAKPAEKRLAFEPSFRRKNLPLGRLYEHLIFTFFASLGTALLLLRKVSFMNQLAVESTFALLWASMVLSISFLEAWVKFKAPFLRKHIATDVG